MDFFNKLGEQFRKFWEETSNSARIGMIATIAISLALIIGVGYWSSQPSYVALQQDIAPDEYDAVLKALEKKGIAYETSASGSVILVDQSKRALANAAINGIVSSDSTPTLGGSMTDGPEIRREAALNRKEAAVEKTIAKFKGIRSVKVQITPGKNSLRRSTFNDARVSVMLEFKSGHHATNQLINAVANNVMYLQGIKRENIFITDSNGVSHSADSEKEHQANLQRKYQLEVENSTREKIEEHLRGMVGMGNFTVSVTADTEYKESQSQSFKVDPNAVPINQKKFDSENLDPQAPGGTAGVRRAQSNFPPSAPNGFNKRKESSEDTQNMYGYSNEQLSKAGGTTNRLSVSVRVQSPVDEDGNPTSTLEQAAVEECVKTAAGIDVARGDLLSVQIGTVVKDPFFDDIFAAPTGEPSISNEYIMEIIRNSSLGLGSIFAFIIGFMVLRKMKPVTITEAEPQISPERSKHLADLSLIAKENPEFLSRIIAGWINETPVDELGGASPDVQTDSAIPSERAAA